MKIISATKFKEQCLRILDQLNAGEVIISKHGKPIAKLVPLQARSAQLIGRLKNKVRIRGDLMSTGTKWNAES